MILRADCRRPEDGGGAVSAIISGDDPVSKGIRRFELFAGAGKRHDWSYVEKASIGTHAGQKARGSVPWRAATHWSLARYTAVARIRCWPIRLLWNGKALHSWRQLSRLMMRRSPTLAAHVAVVVQRPCRSGRGSAVHWSGSAATLMRIKSAPSLLLFEGAMIGLVTCPPDFPPRAIRVWPERRTDDEACKFSEE